MRVSAGQNEESQVNRRRF